MSRQFNSKAGLVVRSRIGWLLLLALLLRGIIPGGFMPDFTAVDGHGFLVVCSPTNSAFLSGQDDTPGAADVRQQDACAFAMLGSFVPLLVLMVLLVWATPHADRRLLSPALRHLRQIICAPPGARAPPTFG